MQFLPYKKEELIDLFEEFISECLHGIVRGSWKVFSAISHTPLENLSPIEDVLKRSILPQFLVDYFNKGIKNMITSNSEDPYFMNNFTEMKEVLNHGYRCLFINASFLCQSILQDLDFKTLELDKDQWEFKNWDDVIGPLLLEKRKKLLKSLSHRCDYKNEDITKWNSEEEMFVARARVEEPIPLRKPPKFN